jgi:hypothetical protein
MAYVCLWVSNLFADNANNTSQGECSETVRFPKTRFSAIHGLRPHLRDISHSHRRCPENLKRILGMAKASRMARFPHYGLSLCLGSCLKPEIQKTHRYVRLWRADQKSFRHLECRRGSLLQYLEKCKRPCHDRRR